MRWPDDRSFGPGNMLYAADSDIPDVVMQSKVHMKAKAPYYLLRFPADGTAPAGQ